MFPGIYDPAYIIVLFLFAVNIALEERECYTVTLTYVGYLFM